MGLGIRAKVNCAWNSLKAGVGVGEYWYWVPDRQVEQAIPIAPLVYPLRYDILIRKDFFDLYAANRDLFHADLDAFLAKAKDHVYYEWFTKVLLARYEPRSMDDERRAMALFQDRVMRSAELHELIRINGFDQRHPIIPFTGMKILPADSGKYTGQKYYMGDGCHRLACLISMMLEKHLAIRWPDSLIEGLQA